MKGRKGNEIVNTLPASWATGAPLAAFLPWQSGHWWYNNESKVITLTVVFTLINADLTCFEDIFNRRHEKA